MIARPYVGKKKGEFVRTSNRRDYALKPTGPTALNALQEAGYDVLAVGKIHDIFDGYGITKSLHSTSSVHGMDQTIALAQSDFCGLCFTNLVDLMRCGDIGEIRSDTERKSSGLTKNLENFCHCLKKKIC